MLTIKGTKSVLLVICCFVIVLLTYKLITKEGNTMTNNISVNKDGESLTIHKDKSIGELKKEDRPLYDSIKKYGDKVETVYKLKYIYKHSTDTIFLDTTKNTTFVDSIYTYQHNTDSVSTKIQVKGVSVDWIKVDTQLNDSLTLINIRERDNNLTKVTSKNNSTIVNETSWRRKERFRDKFVVGPTIGLGYGINNKKIDLFVGVSITYKF